MVWWHTLRIAIMGQLTQWGEHRVGNRGHWHVYNSAEREGGAEGGGGQACPQPRRGVWLWAGEGAWANGGGGGKARGIKGVTAARIAEHLEAVAVQVVDGDFRRPVPLEERVVRFVGRGIWRQRAIVRP